MRPVWVIYGRRQANVCDHPPLFTVPRAARDIDGIYNKAMF